MKKFLALLAALMLACTVACAETAPDSVTVFVSISDDTGALVLALEPVTVTDVDADGALTIYDALACAHAANEIGADAFAAVQTEYGLSMAKLWGVENGGSYGYYLNNASAWSLLDPVTEGDHVKAYASTDLTTWSDTYSYFGADVVSAQVGAEVPLTLVAAGYDASYNPITLPVEGAVLTVNGEATDLITDAEGNVLFTTTEPGEYLISASCETMNLVPPVCQLLVTAE